MGVWTLSKEKCIILFQGGDLITTKPGLANPRSHNIYDVRIGFFLSGISECILNRIKLIKRISVLYNEV